MFYGWRIVAVAALSQGVSAGSTFFVYGAFMKPLVEEFGVSRFAVTLGLTIFSLAQGLVAPFIGRALDVGSPRTVMIAGVVAQSCGLLLLSQTTALWQAGSLFILPIAIGAQLFGPLSAATIVNRWFTRRRGRALGFSSLGASFGGAVFAPLVAALITAFEWRGAATALGAGLLLLIVPIAWIVVRQPEDVGTTPEGDAPSPIAPRRPADEDELASSGSLATAPTTTREILANRNFWAITAAIGFGYGPVGVMLAHLFSFTTDLGYSAQQAGFVMGCYALAGAPGRLFFGWFSDRIGKRAVVWLMYAIFAVAWGGLFDEPSYPVLVATALAIGFAVGGIAPLWGALTGAVYGRDTFGRAMGWMNLLMLPFSLVGAPIAALLFDRTQSYEVAFASFTVCFLLGATAITFLRVPQSDPTP